MISSVRTTLERRRRRLVYGLTLGAAVAALAAVPASATTVTFCSGTFSGGQFCSRQASFSLNSIAASTNGVDAVCVYRATANYDGAPSASGQEYCIAAGNSNVAQAFYGYTGNPTVHNRHSYNVAVGAAYDRN